MVVDRDEPRRLVGYLGRQEVLVAWSRWMGEEKVPEGGGFFVRLKTLPEIVGWFKKSVKRDQ